MTDNWINSLYQDKPLRRNNSSNNHHNASSSSLLPHYSDEDEERFDTTSASVAAAATNSVPKHLSTTTLLELTPESLSRRPMRCIMLLDMDCYYAQCEAEHYPHLRNEPLAVLQNGTLCVTTNYRIRARGLPKMAPGPVLAKLCPRARFVGSDMRRYRGMARQWQKILQSFGAPVQRKSIDESYTDLTQLARDRIKRDGAIRACRRVIVHRNPHELELERQKRFVAAEQQWRQDEVELQKQFNNELRPELLESSGSLHAAVRASQSTDPITQLRVQQAGGDLDALGKAATNYDANSSSTYSAAAEKCKNTTQFN
jgi:hypothetical protein